MSTIAQQQNESQAPPRRGVVELDLIERRVVAGEILGFQHSGSMLRRSVFDTAEVRVTVLLQSPGGGVGSLKLDDPYLLHAFAAMRPQVGEYVVARFCGQRDPQEVHQDSYLETYIERKRVYEVEAPFRSPAPDWEDLEYDAFQEICSQMEYVKEEPPE